MRRAKRKRVIVRLASPQVNMQVWVRSDVLPRVLTARRNARSGAQWMDYIMERT